MQQIDYKKEYFLEGGEEGCLLVHGITGTPAELRELGELLNSKGYTVLGVRLKGHGTVVEDMLDCTYRDWITSAVEGFEHLRRKCSKVYVIGHSMGSLIALYIEEHLKAEKIVTLSPPIVVKNWTTNLAFAAKYFIKYSVWKPREFTPEQEKYIVGYSSIPIKSADELNKLRAAVRKNLKHVSCPILMIHSYGDEVVADKSIDVLYDKVSSKNKKKLFLDTSGHLVAVENEKEKVFSAIVDFLGADGKD